MDVRCERCRTAYELDPARVSEAGTAVRCTTCGHVFRVRRKTLLVTEAVTPGGEASAVPPPVAEKPQWQVRSPAGKVVAFRELTSLQKWIVERKFGRDDEISLKGDTWKRLGEIPELQPFFALVEEVDRARALAARLRASEPLDEGPASLERAIAGTPTPVSTPVVGTPTPLRLEVPIVPVRPEPSAGPGGSGPSGQRLPDVPPARPPVRFGDDLPVRSEPTPSRGPTFSLDDIREATRPGPEDRDMPAGPVEPGPSGPGPAPDEMPPSDADQPAFTRRAGLGVSPDASVDDDDWAPPRRRSRAPLVATLLLLALAGAGVAAYVTVWLPAQEAQRRLDAERARVEREQQAGASRDADTRAREERAKAELLAGLARRDGGTVADGGLAGGGAPTPAGAGTAGPTAPGTPAPNAAGATGERGTGPLSTPGGADAAGASGADAGVHGEAAPPGATDGTTTASLLPRLSGPAQATDATPVPSRPGPRPVETTRSRSRAPEPRTFEDWMARGDREAEGQRLSAAVDAYDRAIALSPGAPEAHVARGRTLLQLGNGDWATASFRRALELNPRYAVAQFWLGEAHRRAGRKAEAVRAYGQYLALSPEGAEAGAARQALRGLQE